MARFSVQMTFEAPTQRTPPRQVTTSLPRDGTVRYLVGDGTVALTARVHAESAADAALRLCRAVEREEWTHGRGPLRLVSWTASRSVPVLAGLGRRRQRFSGGRSGWDDGGWYDPDDGGDEGGGTAGVREPRRPKPSPGTMSAALDEPKPL